MRKEDKERLDRLQASALNTRLWSGTTSVFFVAVVSMFVNPCGALTLAVFGGSIVNMVSIVLMGSDARPYVDKLTVGATVVGSGLACILTLVGRLLLEIVLMS